MAEKNINSRIMQKHDTEANWKKATNFIPKAGEIVIYDADDTYSAARIKVGNNSTTINELPFISSNDDKIFIAEYGVTTFEEIIQAANTDNKIVLCRATDNAVFTLAYCYADGARFVGYTANGEKEACCSPSNEWSLSDISNVSSQTYCKITLSLVTGNTYSLEVNDNGVIDAYICTLKDTKWINLTADSTRINQIAYQYALEVANTNEENLRRISFAFIRADQSKFKATIQNNSCVTTSLCSLMSTEFDGIYFQCGNSLIRFFINSGGEDEPT